MKRTLAALPAPASAGALARARALAGADGWDLLLPPAAAPARGRPALGRDALASWLEREAPQAAGVLVSIDTLLYGGLPRERSPDDALNALLPRLALLARLRGRKKGLVIHAVLAVGPGSAALELAVHEALFELVACGAVDLLTLVDDRPPHGLHPCQQRMADRALNGRVLLEPSGSGADARLLVQAARLMAAAHELLRRPRRNP